MSGEHDERHDGFEELLADLDTPMFIVTAAAGNERDGCLVGFTTQCSIDPSQFAVWLSKQNRTYRIARHASTLVVHLVREDQCELADWFGGETGDEVDKLAGIDWHAGPDGAPVLSGCDWFGGRVLERVDVGGDHVAFVLEPLGGEVSRRGTRPLGLQRAKHIDPGHDA